MPERLPAGPSERATPAEEPGSVLADETGMPADPSAASACVRDAATAGPEACRGIIRFAICKRLPCDRLMSAGASCAGSFDALFDTRESGPAGDEARWALSAGTGVRSKPEADPGRVPVTPASDPPPVRLPRSFWISAANRFSG